MQSFAYPKATRGPRPRTRHSLMHMHSSDAYALLGCTCAPWMHMHSLIHMRPSDAYALLGCTCAPRMHTHCSDAHAPLGDACACALLPCCLYVHPHPTLPLTSRVHEQAVQGAGRRVPGAGYRVQGTRPPSTSCSASLEEPGRARVQGAGRRAQGTPRSSLDDLDDVLGRRAQGAGHAALLT